jgi:aminoglycoside phosphotransferase (APT) family kinase protein
MAKMPSAEPQIGVPLVTRLVAEEFPHLAQHPLHSPAEGWDNVIFRLGGHLAVRLPRREVAVPLAENEHRWLPGIGERVSIPVPVPLLTGRPTAYYPWPWSIVSWIDGASVGGMPVASRTALAASLAEYIGELHRTAPADAPRNPVRGVPLASRDAAVMSRLSGSAVPRSGELLPLWERLRLTEVWRGKPLWLHGDLHPGNLLASEGNLTGVIDFGDLTAGDPATDLATAWLTFDSAGREAFLARLPAAYRSDTALLDRSRGWALSLATAFATLSDDNPAMAATGAHAIDQVLEE